MDPDQTDLGPHCFQKRLFFKSQTDDNYCDWQFKGLEEYHKCI